MKKHFECQCESDEHRIAFSSDEYNGEQEISITYYLENYRRFWNRCWVALKYIFKKSRHEGDFDCTLIKNEDLQTIIDMFVSVQNNYNLQDRKVSLNIDCETNEEAQTYLNAFDYMKALDNIRDNIRSIWKYEELSVEVFEKVDEIYEGVCNEISDIGEI